MAIILITGSSRGIGFYLTEALLSEGHQVIGCSRGVTELEHPNFQHVQLDICSEPDVKKLFSTIRKTYGGLDVLINNAGIAAMNHSLLTPKSTVDAVLSVNVAANFIFCREAAKLMRKKKSGRIINFSTVAVPFNLEGEAIYAASKSAVETLTRVFAKEFAEFGIRVNAVGPTPIQTDLIKNIPQDKIKKLLEQQTIKRMGEMADVINVVRFFLQPESDFVTGQVIYLGGAS